MLLGGERDRGSFTCGVESLDRYLKTQAGQDVCRKANAVFILSEVGAPARMLGYYTFARWRSPKAPYRTPAPPADERH